jgi:hypothetical protein
MSEPLPDPAATPSPTVTHHERVAAEFIAAIEQAFALVGELQTPHPAREPFVRSNHTVPIGFIADAAVLVEDSPELQSVKRLDPAEARDVLQYLAAYEPAANRVEILLQALRFTMRAKKAKVADEALQIYLLAKLYGRKRDGAAMAERATVLRRSLGRAGKHRRKLVAATP